MEALEVVRRNAFVKAALEADPLAIEAIGAGFLAAETLAIAVYCVLGTSNFEAAVLAAVNHSGDSDVADAIAGALYGTNAIPIDLLREVEGRNAMVGFDAGLVGYTGLEPWTEGAIGENAYDEMITPEEEARAAEAGIREAVEAGEDVDKAIALYASSQPEVAAKM